MQSSRSLTQWAKSPREESAGHGGWHLGRMTLLMNWWMCSGMRQVAAVQSCDHNKNHLPVTSLWWAAWRGSHISIQEQTQPPHSPALPASRDSVTSCTAINNHLELPQRHNSCCLSSLSRYKTIFFLTSCDPLHIYTISNSKWFPASLPKYCKEVLVCMIEILYPLGGARIKLVTAYKMLIMLLNNK